MHDLHFSAPHSSPFSQTDLELPSQFPQIYFYKYGFVISVLWHQNQGRQEKHHSHLFENLYHFTSSIFPFWWPLAAGYWSHLWKFLIIHFFFILYSTLTLFFTFSLRIYLNSLNTWTALCNCFSYSREDIFFMEVFLAFCINRWVFY